MLIGWARQALQPYASMFYDEVEEEQKEVALKKCCVHVSLNKDHC